MRKKMIDLTQAMAEHLEEVRRIRNNERFAASYKDEQEKKAKENFNSLVDKTFNEAENRINQEEEKAKKNLQELQDAGDYNQRTYAYTRAINEMANYKDPQEYFENKATQAEGIELEEARKAVAANLQAKDPAGYEAFKEKVIKTMPEEEYNTRKEIAKAQLKKNDLKTLRGHFDFVREQAENNPDYLDIGQKDLIAISGETDLDSQAEKKISETL